MSESDRFIDRLRALGVTPPPLSDDQLADPEERLAWVERVEATCQEITRLRDPEWLPPTSVEEDES